MDLQAMVREFMEAKGIVTRTSPTIPSADEMMPRVRYMLEEMTELMEACHDQDTVEVADALGDLLYFVVGTFVTCGMPMETIFAEIHRSNMTKTRLNTLGKGGKTAEFSPPNLKPLLLPLEGNDNPAFTGPIS